MFWQNNTIRGNFLYMESRFLTILIERAIWKLQFEQELIGSLSNSRNRVPSKSRFCGKLHHSKIINCILKLYCIPFAGFLSRMQSSRFRRNQSARLRIRNRLRRVVIPDILNRWIMRLVSHPDMLCCVWMIVKD